MRASNPHLPTVVTFSHGSFLDRELLFFSLQQSLSLPLGISMNPHRPYLFIQSEAKVESSRQ